MKRQGTLECSASPDRANRVPAFFEELAQTSQPPIDVQGRCVTRLLHWSRFVFGRRREALAQLFVVNEAAGQSRPCHRPEAHDGCQQHGQNAGQWRLVAFSREGENQHGHHAGNTRENRRHRGALFVDLDGVVADAGQRLDQLFGGFPGQLGGNGAQRGAYQDEHRAEEQPALVAPDEGQKKDE
jgi:hypothetical protein